MNDVLAKAPVARDLTFDLPGGRVFARRWQPQGDLVSGAPILLLHDSLGCVELWRDFPSGLARATSREVVAYDRLGFGQSAPRTELPSLDFITEEGRDIFPMVCERLGLSQVIVCGHSVGGGMAVEAAAAHPDRVTALVTIAAQAFIEDRTRQGIEAAKSAFSSAASLERLARYHGEKARWAVDAWTETWLAPDFADWSLNAALGKITCPALAIHGERDEYGNTDQAMRIANGADRNAVIIPGAGHVPHKECPETLIKIIAEFLDCQA